MKIKLIITFSLWVLIYSCDNATKKPQDGETVSHNDTLQQDNSKIKSLLEEPLGGGENNSKLIFELIDLYRAFHINNIIVDQDEMINVYLNKYSDAETKNLLQGYIKVCDSLKVIHFKNDTLNSYVSKYLALTIQSYKIARSKGINSSGFKKDFETYEKEESKYMNYLYSTYSTNHFVSITEEKYWQIIDPKKYIKSSDYDTYLSLRSTNLEDALALLDKISKKTNDFQEFSIYQIELADQYVMNKNILGINSPEKAIGIYKAILDKKKYSIYLFDCWLKWRAVTQLLNGASKTSDIPNDEYDKVREQVALTILNYITKNEKDEMAINEFLLMATHDIIKRFGGFSYGNQNIPEYNALFNKN